MNYSLFAPFLDYFLEDLLDLLLWLLLLWLLLLWLLLLEWLLIDILSSGFGCAISSAGFSLVNPYSYSSGAYENFLRPATVAKVQSASNPRAIPMGINMEISILLVPD